MNASFKREQLHGLTANDALIKYLTDRGTHFQVQVTGQNRTKYLFIAYPESIQLAYKNQDVVLIDSTYKTNKFDMPLLHMVLMSVDKPICADPVSVLGICLF